MLVLPTKDIAEVLIEFIDKDVEPTARFLLGFKNRLSSDFTWILSKEDSHCGLAYCYSIIINEEMEKKLLSYENASSRIEKIVNNYVLIAKDEVKFAKPDDISALLADKIADIKKQISHPSQGVIDSIYLNNFDSIEAYQASGLGVLERS